MMEQLKYIVSLIIFARFVSMAGVVVIIFVLLFTACGSSQGPGLLMPATPAVTAQPTSSTAETFPIKVYFSKSPESENNFAAVFPVDRVSPTRQVGTFAIQSLIAGPTPQERTAGCFSELGGLLSGPSNCSGPSPVGGPDFQLKLNQRGTVTEQGTATLQFCRAINSPGIGADARVTAEINATLKQFSTIKKSVILTKEGHCFGDESGLDRCLK
jgi:hypothetical protein